MRGSAIAGAAVLLAAVGACTAPGAPASTASGPGEAQHVDLDGADMCRALSDAQIASIHVGRGVATPGDVTNAAGPGCGWTRSSTKFHEGFAVRLGLEGIGKLAPAPRGSGDGRLTVAGFPALETRIQGQGSPQVGCTVSVGVAPERRLDSIYLYNGPESAMTREKACRNATEVAEMAMQTLLARKKDS